MGGVGRVFLGLCIVLGGLLVSASIAAVVAYDAAKPLIEREYPTHLYERRDECRDLPCAEPLAEDGFVVTSGMNEVSLSIYAVLEDASGPARITVTDPTGDVRYSRYFTPELTLDARQEVATWPAEAGEWTIARSYAGVRGSLTFEAWGFGLSPGTL